MNEPPRRASRSNMECGSISVLVIGSVFLACVLALISVDMMRAFQAKAKAQTAADAAALAAAQEIAIPSGRSPAELAAEYAQRNGATLLSCACDPGTSSAQVEVSVPLDVVFLSPGRTIAGAARAVIAPESGAESGRDRRGPDGRGPP